jgi:hypothetical protein
LAISKKTEARCSLSKRLSESVRGSAVLGDEAGAVFGFPDVLLDGTIDHLFSG